MNEYQGKASLSRQEVKKAWDFEKQGKTREEAAERAHVCVKTLYRMYRRYGLPSPKKKEGGKRV